MRTRELDDDAYVRGIWEEMTWRDIPPMAPGIADAWWSWFRGEITYCECVWRITEAAGAGGLPAARSAFGASLVQSAYNGGTRG